MSKNNKQTKAVAKPKNAQPKPKTSTPFANAGSALAKTFGKLSGLGDLGPVGSLLGSGIGRIFGSGDYEMVGPSPDYNVLQGQIPKFSTTHATNIVTHREYLGDIAGTAAFNNTGYALNPGLSSTFPWLSAIASQYQQYKFHGLAFEFRPLITDYVTGGAPGVVVMATNYNSGAPIYESKQQMENSEFAVSVKPTNNLMHLIECKPDQTVLPTKYVRSSAVPSGEDPKTYDLGLFQFATQANPTQNLGELWCTYTIEFFKPIITYPMGSLHYVGTSTSKTNPLGTLYQMSGQLSWKATGSTITAREVSPGRNYLVSLLYNNGGVNYYNLPTLTLTGATFINEMQVGGSSVTPMPNTSVVTNNAGVTWTIQATSPIVTFSFDASGDVAIAGNVDLFLTVMDPTQY